MNDRRAAAVLFVFFLACAAVFAFLALVVDSRRRVIHGNDGAGYYVYGRSLMMDGDLDFTNDFEEIFPGEVPRASWRTAVGRPPNEYGIGFSLFALPFLAPAHGLVRLAAFLGAPVRTDGGSAPEKLVACLASEFWGSLGLWLAYRALRTRFPPGLAVASVLLVGFSTSVFYYFLREPFLSHLDALFCVGGLLYLVLAAEARGSPVHPLAAGMACGALALVHPSDAVYLVLPVTLTLLAPSRGGRTGAARFGSLALLGLGAALAFTPQLVAWKVITGRWLADPYPDQSFAFLARPKILDVLFSSNHGLVSWTPIVVLSIAGLGIVAKRQRALGIACLAAFAALLYTYASWWQWWLGNSFGARGFVSMVPIFALGLATFLDWARRRPALARLWPCLLVFPIWNVVLILSYLAGMIPYAGTFSWIDLVRELSDLPARVLGKAAGA